MQFINKLTLVSKSRLVVVFIFLLIGGTIFSQDANLESNAPEMNLIAKNAIHADIGTIIFMAYTTINYEVTIKLTPGKSILRFRTGFYHGFDYYTFGIPLNLTALFGQSKRYFEFTAGIVPRIDLENKLSIYPLVDVGYRYEPGKGRIIFRAKIGTSGLGLGLGYAF